jgi:hypothetical protein
MKRRAPLATRTIRLVIAVCACSLSAVALWAQSDSWYDESWPLRQEITIDSDNAAFGLAADLTAFPVLVSITGADSLFASAKSNGADILFTASDGVTKIPHEIERYDAANQVFLAWVRLPTFIHDANTIIYCYYGNPSAASQEDASGVWDANFELVMHLPEAVTAGQTTGSHFDSTGNGFIGTQYRNSPYASGRGDRAQLFERDDAAPIDSDKNDVIEVGNVYTDDWTAITVEAWINRTSTEDSRVVVKSVAKSLTDAVFFLGVDGENVRILLATNNGAYQGTTATAIGTGTWVHLAFTWDAASDTIRLYRNGTQFGTPGRTGDTLATCQRPPTIPPSSSEATRPIPTRPDRQPLLPRRHRRGAAVPQRQVGRLAEGGVREPGQP